MKNATARKSKKLEILEYEGYLGRLGRLYSHQVDYAKVIAALVNKGVRFIRLHAPMQSGKTGIIEALAQLEIVPRPVQFISAVPFKENRKQDFLRLANAGVLMLDKYKNKNNFSRAIQKRAIVVLDESQYGTHIAGLVSQCVRTAVFDRKDVVLVTMSATDFPEKFAHGWAKRSESVIVDLDRLQEEGYFGVESMLSAGNVIDTQNERVVYGKELHPKAKQLVKKFLGQRERMVMLWRVGYKDMEAAKKALEKEFEFSSDPAKLVKGKKRRIVDEHTMHQSFDFAHINEVTGHTIILMKQKMRVGMTIPNKSNIYAIWETAATLATLVQSLIGRICTFRSVDNDNSKILVYADKKTLERHAYYERFGKVINNGATLNVDGRVKMLDKGVAPSGKTGRGHGKKTHDRWHHEHDDWTTKLKKVSFKPPKGSFKTNRKAHEAFQKKMIKHIERLKPGVHVQVSSTTQYKYLGERYDQVGPNFKPNAPAHHDERYFLQYEDRSRKKFWARLTYSIKQAKRRPKELDPNEAYAETKPSSVWREVSDDLENVLPLGIARIKRNRKKKKK